MSADIGMLRDEFLRLARAMRESARCMVDPVVFDRFGLTPQQMYVLMAVRDHPGAPTGSISDSAGILRTNFAQVCRKLEEAGLVERRRSDEDHRVVRLQLTDRGRAVVDAVDRTVEERLSAQFEAEDPSFVEDLVCGMRNMRAFVERLA